MTFVAAALLIVPLQYGFEPGFQVKYDSEITFEGFIPIFGGNEGTVVVSMVVAVDGLEPEEDAPLRAASEITSFKVTFGPAVLPLDVTDAQDYFPRTTIWLTPQGKIVKSDAPDIKLPVRLPGLDVKRFPDITYVPIQFPLDGATVGQEWSFKKTFGDSDMLYSCRLMKVTDGIAKIAVQIEQEYELLENAALEVVEDEIDAERRVKTTIAGAGVVYFDTRRGLVKEVLMVNEATSVATSLFDGEVTERVLMTTFSLKLHASIPSHDEPVGGGLGRGSNKKSPFHTIPSPDEPVGICRAKPPVEASPAQRLGRGSELIPSHDEPVGGGLGRGSKNESPFRQDSPPQTLLEAAWSSAKETANNALSWAKSAWTVVKFTLSSVLGSLAGK